MLVLYHDDFDGAASATLLSAYAQQQWGNLPSQYIPVDYWMGSTWADPLDSEQFTAVVDFQYDPRADVWFDHHATALNHHGGTFTPKVWHVWDPNAPSCAELIARHIRTMHPNWGTQYQPLIDAATRIDQAQYRSPTEYFNASAPGIGLQHAWAKFAPNRKAEIIRQLVHHSLVHVEADVAHFIKAQVTKNWYGIERFDTVATLQDGIVRADLAAIDTPFVRFAGFYCYPKAAYTVVLFNAGGTYGVHLSRNPWAPTPGPHLGELAKHYGGGGHEHAAGVSLQSYSEAIRVYWSVIDALKVTVCSAA